VFSRSNMSKFNKAIAMMFFSVFAAVFKIPPSWKRPFGLLFARLKRSVLWVRPAAIQKGKYRWPTARLCKFGIWEGACRGGPGSG
jgi:hypothetical protein